MSTEISSRPARELHSPHLVREADHRIANSLMMISSLVRLRAVHKEIPDPKTFLTEVADRIETVARLHRLLSNSDSEFVQLRKYLLEICDRLSTAVTRSPPVVAFHCSPDIVMRSSSALPIGLITAELVSNSLKYAHPTGLRVKIDLTCTQTDNDQLTIVYQDDGVGFPEGFDPSRDRHVGMVLIGALSGQLNATHEWSSDALGIRFVMVVPLLAGCE